MSQPGGKPPRPRGKKAEPEWKSGPGPCGKQREKGEKGKGEKIEQSGWQVALDFFDHFVGLLALGAGIGAEDLLLAPGQAGPLKLGMTIDELYGKYGRENTGS